MDGRVGPRKVTHVVMLACRHSATFPEPAPMVGEEVYCFRCAKMCVVETAPDEFRIKCRSCTYAKPFGTLRLSAEMAATKHLRRRPNHVIDIYNGRERYVTLGNQSRASEQLQTTREQLRAAYEGRQGTLFDLASSPENAPPF